MTPAQQPLLGSTVIGVPLLFLVGAYAEVLRITAGWTELSSAWARRSTN